MQIYFHSRLWSYLPRVPILVEGSVHMLGVLVRSGDLGLIVLVWIGARLPCSHMPKINRAKGGNVSAVKTP